MFVPLEFENTTILQGSSSTCQSSHAHVSEKSQAIVQADSSRECPVSIGECLDGFWDDESPLNLDTDSLFFNSFGAIPDHCVSYDDDDDDDASFGCFTEFSYFDDHQKDKLPSDCILFSFIISVQEWEWQSLIAWLFFLFTTLS